MTMKEERPPDSSAMSVTMPVSAAAENRCAC